jgi:hypothetical protein
MKKILLRLWESPTFTTWGSFATRLLSITVVLPLTLTKLEASEVAVMQLFNSINAMLMILDFGLAPTLTRMFSYAVGGASVSDLANMRAPRVEQRTGKNTDTMRLIYGNLKWLYVRMSLIMTIGLALVGTLLLIKPIGQTPEPTHAWIAWVITLSSCAISLWGTVYGAALQGANQIAPVRRWETFFALLQILSSFAVLFGGGGLLLLIAANKIWTVFSVLRNQWMVSRKVPELSGTPTEKTPEVIKALWPATWRSGVGILMSQGIIQSSGLIYSQFAAAGEVASYLFALRLMTLISQVSQVPFYTKLPILATLQAAGSNQEQVNIAKKGMAISFWVYVLGALGVLLVVYPFLEHIKSNVQFVSPTFWVVMSFAYFLERYGAMHIQLYSVSGHIVWHIANGVTGILMTIAALVAVPYLGNIGMPLAMLLAYGLFYAVYCRMQSQRILRGSIVRYEGIVSLPPFILLVVGFSLYWMKSILY